MSSFKVRPSKPAAILGAIFGVAVILFVVLGGIGKGGPFIWLWVAGGLAIIGFNLWAAFGKRGATEVVEYEKR
ncbi:hypothetical protein L3Q67_44125 [Saccharothrix sp. AJ9571]|nr:hypothetical protein L3Q67_44125 [Saccharothrix sp. AJ9571]